MATLQDVAQRAGVSTATVSKVLSNTPYFSEATREKVMRAVEEVGYIPNLAARALSTGRTYIIGFVFPYVYDGIFEDPNILRILEGVEAECREQGYNILLASPRLTEHIQDDHYDQLLRSRYMDGVIVFDPLPSASVMKDIKALKIPTVGITHRKAAYTVTADDYQGGKDLMGHILSLGHRRIGIISVPPSMHLGIERRLAGMRGAAEEVSIDFDSFPIIDGDFSMESGEEGAARLIEGYPDLTAYVAINDRMAIGAMRYIQARGLSVPEDLSIVGYDDIPMAAMSNPALTTVNQQAPITGRTAAQMLFKILDKKKPDVVYIPAQLVIRQSSAAPRS